MRYRIAIRAAWILGNNSEERKAIAKHTRGLYDLRSTIVHGGAPELNSSEIYHRSQEIEDLTRRCVNAWITAADAGKPIDLASLGLGED